MKEIHRTVQVWLWIGVVMIFVQILVGGITRLTGSGLSITKWEIITGTIPPMNEAEWTIAFDAYKQTPQYGKINKGMDMKEFKFIFFWEYVHRLWARIMGFVFIIPLIYFLIKRWIPREMIPQLSLVFILAALVASFGWIMVASGLMDRPWVNAYKLMLHLGLAILTYGVLFWIALRWSVKPLSIPSSLSRSTGVLIVVASIQILLGGLMSGMKAGLFYPEWPMMGGEWFPDVLQDFGQWQLIKMTQYDHPDNTFAVALIQFLHRGTAYLLTFLTILFLQRVIRIYTAGRVVLFSYITLMLLALQVGLGIATLLECKGKIPVLLGSTHQMVAILLLSSFILLHYFLHGNKRILYMMD